MSKQIRIQSYRTTSDKSAAGNAGSNQPSAGGSRITRHNQLEGIVNTADAYSSFARDIHLSATHADALKRLSTLEIIKTEDLTLPTDDNIYSAARTDKEIDDLLIEVNKMFLRKDIDDTAHGVITFDNRIGSTINLDGYDGKGWEIKETGAALFGSARVRSDIHIGGKFGSPSYASGFTGWGVEIDIPTASGTFDFLTVRKSMKVHELVYSQIYGLGGSVIISDQNKILYVEALRDFYRCYMDSMDGAMRMNLRKDDIVRMQRSSGINIRYFYGEVLSVTPNYFDLKIIDGEDCPEMGDVVFRFGNKSDKSRQGIIYLTSSDDNAPYIDVLDGITDQSMFEKIKVRLGNFSGIRTKKGVPLNGYGIYAQGAVFEDTDIYLQDGTTVEQQFIVMNGKFESTIEGIRNDMSVEAGNILKNSSFGQNLNYWKMANDISFINVDSNFLWMDGSFYSEKQSVADIYRDGSKNVLRILNTAIVQSNDIFKGEKTEGSYSFSFYYKVLRPGTLSAGFSGQKLFATELLSVSDSYQKLSKVAKWDGTGDFSIGFTGEILIYGVSLFNDALADAQIKLQTQIDQTAEYIKLLATKDYVDKETGEIYIHYDSKLQITAEQISAVSTRVNNINNTIATAGWITTADGNRLYATVSTVSSLTGRVSTAESSISNNANAITQKVSTTDYDGKTIISKVNQTATSYQIDAKNINLNGIVTANNNFKILLDGSMQTIAGSIGGLRIESGGIFSEHYTTGDTNNKFFLHSGGSSGFLGFSSSSKWAGLGLNTLPSTLGGVSALLRLENTGRSSDKNNYGALIDVRNGARSVALECIGTTRLRGSVMMARKCIVTDTTNNIISNIGYQDRFFYQVNEYRRVQLPSSAQIYDAVGQIYADSNESYINTTNSAWIEIVILNSRWSTGNLSIEGVNGTPLVDTDGNINNATGSSTGGYGSRYLAKGDSVTLVFFNNTWYTANVSN